MEDLRHLALRIWGTGDVEHAKQLRDQIKLWEQDATWPQKVPTPLIRYSWDKAQADLLKLMISGTSGYESVNNDLLTLRGSDQEFYTVNYAFELALLRLAQQPNFRINMGPISQLPVATIGRNDLYSTNDPEDKFSGFIFPKHQLANQMNYTVCWHRLISETNTILLPMGKPRIPEIPFTS